MTAHLANVIARGALPDEGFQFLSDMATRLLALLEEAGHGEATLCLRHGNAARPHAPNGPCLVLSVLTPEGGWAVHGFAYVFMPYAADTRERLDAALRAAGPDSFKPARAITWTQRSAA